MSFINSVLKVFVGDKSKKDLKILQPIVDEVRAFDSQMESLTLDQLRSKTVEFKQKINENIKTFEDTIVKLKEEILT